VEPHHLGRLLRTMLAGIVAPTEASRGALLVLYTACLHYGAPETLISDSGGAFTSRAFEAVLVRLQIHHETIESTKGESYQNLMETHFNIQRRVYDYQFSWTTTPAAFAQAHQAFITTDNTTAHQGPLNDQFDPPIPLQVLGEATGRRYSAEELNRHFAHDLFPRTTNPYGCVTFHHYHFYVEQGWPTTPVLLWLSGDQLRAVFDNVVVAEYHCHYDWRSRDGRISETACFTTPVMPHHKARCSLSPPKSLGCSIARRLEGVAGVGPSLLSNYFSLNGYPRRKAGLTSHICNEIMTRAAPGHLPSVWPRASPRTHRPCGLAGALGVLRPDSTRHAGDEAMYSHSIATSQRVAPGLLGWDAVSHTSA
jgi:hypothetical protein